MLRFSVLVLTGLLGLSACNSNHKDETYHRVAILGNSITIHGPKPSVGWNRNWGMAASAPQFDYVHLLTKQFQQKDAGAQVAVKSIAPWEKHYWDYDIHQLDSIRSFNPDLVIIRIGENVLADSLQSGSFKPYFGQLLDYLGGAHTRVAVFGSFWKKPEVTDAMKIVCDKRNVEFVSLADLSDVPSNEATGQYPNPGVAQHPSDKGMKAIADKIWNNL